MKSAGQINVVNGKVKTTTPRSLKRFGISAASFFGKFNTEEEADSDTHTDTYARMCYHPQGDSSYHPQGDSSYHPQGDSSYHPQGDRYFIDVTQ